MCITLKFIEGLSLKEIAKYLQEKIEQEKGQYPFFSVGTNKHGMYTYLCNKKCSDHDKTSLLPTTGDVWFGIKNEQYSEADIEFFKKNKFTHVKELFEKTETHENLHTGLPQKYYLVIKYHY